MAEVDTQEAQQPILPKEVIYCGGKCQLRSDFS